MRVVWMSVVVGLFGCQSFGETGEALNAAHPKGWYFYSEELKEKAEEMEIPRPMRKNLTNVQKKGEARREQAPQRKYTQEAKKFKEDLEEAQSQAVQYPTYKNVARFKKYHDRSIKKSDQFSKMWMLVNLLEGGMDPSANSSTRFRRVYDTEQDKKLDQEIRRVAKDYGLFFFFKGDCSYCHSFAPIVKEFAETYGFEVKAISADGGSLKEFPDAVPDNGIIGALHPDGRMPMLFLAHPQSKEVMALSWGLSSFEDLRTNLRHILVGIGVL